MKEWSFPARTDSIPELTALIDTELEAVSCPLKNRMQLDVIIDEVFSNICRYAYGAGAGDASVCFRFDGEKNEVSLTFRDRGIPYDPLESREPDVTLSAEEREIGGLGIFLVKKTMDAVRYEYRDGRNVLQIEKRLEPPLALPE
jgi:anti-sigma regulatory factor (Ser/Thr protein kinase)